jgi:hypothetical protein
LGLERERVRERVRERGRERQTDRQTDRHTHTHTERAGARLTRGGRGGPKRGRDERQVF